MTGFQGRKIAGPDRGPGGLRGLLAIRRLVRRVVAKGGACPERQNHRGHANAASHESSPFRVNCLTSRRLYRTAAAPRRIFLLAAPVGIGIVWQDHGARRAFNGGTGNERDDSPSAYACPGRAVRRADRRPRPAAPLTSDQVVKATVVAGKPGPDGKQVVTLTLAIDKPWHLYANPVGPEELVPVQTVVSVKAKGALDNVKIDYPAGKKVKDAVFGDYRVYEDSATITISVNRAKGDDSPLELTVKIQACDNSTCRLSSELKLTAAP